jgi:hypothetical protein
MTWPPSDDPGWADRVTRAGVPLDRWDGDLDDYEFAFYGATIVRALSESRLSDEDGYPLLVQFASGHVPWVDWPPEAPRIARRCATVLAARGTCDLDTFVCAPRQEALVAARDAIIADVSLTPAGLLAVLADHWEQLAHLEMPIDSQRTLLAFDEEVLLEPDVAACAYIWSTLEPASSSAPDPEASPAWSGWSAVAADDWSNVVSAELNRLGRGAQHVPDDLDEATMLLAAGRAAVLQADGDIAQIAASIVRTTGCPNDTGHIDALARRAIELARQHLDDIEPGCDNDEIVDSVQRELVPFPDVLREWIRDPCFGTLHDDVGSSTGADMLRAAADWLTWSVARDAVDVIIAIRESGRTKA